MKDETKNIFHKFSFVIGKNIDASTCVLATRILAVKVSVVEAFCFMLMQQGFHSYCSESQFYTTKGQLYTINQSKSQWRKMYE